MRDRDLTTKQQAEIHEEGVLQNAKGAIRTWTAGQHRRSGTRVPPVVPCGLLSTFVLDVLHFLYHKNWQLVLSVQIHYQYRNVYHIVRNCSTAQQEISTLTKLPSVQIATISCTQVQTQKMVFAPICESGRNSEGDSCPFSEFRSVFENSYPFSSFRDLFQTSR